MKLIHTLFIAALLMVFSSTTMAQVDEPNGFGINHQFGVAAAFGDGFLGSVHWTHDWGIGAKRNLRLGYGVRLNSYMGGSDERLYTSAPPELSTDPLFIDSLTIASAQTNNLALFVQAAYRIKKFDVGFNIDAIGFGFGASKTGHHHTVDPDHVANGIQQNSTPTQLTALLIGDNDIGMLNSEFTVGYWPTSSIHIRAGYNFLFTEYTTDARLRKSNDRFRNKAGLFMVGLSFSPKRN